MNNYKYIVVFFVLSYTNFLGLIESDSINFGFPLRDYILFLIIFVLLKDIFYKKFYYFFDKRILKSVLLICGIVLFIIATMPLRGDISVFSSFKFGRIFFVLLLTYIIYKDIKISNSYSFYKKLLYFLAYYYSIIVFINIFFPAFVNTIFVGGEAVLYSDSWGLGSQRYVIKSNAGILFIHLGFALKFFEYFYTKKVHLSGLVLLALAVFLQGWRAPLIAIFSSVFVLFLLTSGRKLLYIIPLILLLLSSVFIFEKYSNENIVIGKLISAYEEITGSKEGTLDGRLQRSALYQIPMFLNQPIIGYGFVDDETPFGRQLGHQGDGLYSLYYFDFGYMTLLNMFGILGFIFFIYQLWQILKYNISNKIKKKDRFFYLAAATFLLSLLLSNYSFGSFTSAVGLLPLAYILGVVQGIDSIKSYSEHKLMTE